MIFSSPELATAIGFLIGSFCLGYAAGYTVWLVKKAFEQL